ncbi:MAG: hypothetical protein JW943_03145, partial [Deltaproteobacteria bacterium]|nr:hypothetical protein [Deltaproteobacteria bacterium]
MNRAVYEGLSLSPGIGVAPVFRLSSPAFETTGRQVAPEHREAEAVRLETACAEVTLALQESAADKTRPVMIDILSDPLFHGSMVDRVRNGRTAEDAVVETAFDLKVIFGEIPDPVLRARGDHAEELGRHIFKRLKKLP